MIRWSPLSSVNASEQKISILVSIQNNKKRGMMKASVVGKKLMGRLLFLFALLYLQGCFDRDPQRFQWQLQSHALEKSIDFQELKVFSENIKQMSGNRLQITVHSSGELTSGPDIFNAVKDRRIEMGNGWPNWWSGQNPEWALLNAGPFDFMNIDASMMFFMAGEGTKLANSLSLPEGVMWRPAWWAGMEFGLLSKEPIKGLSDLKKKKVRIGPGLPSEVLSAAAGAFTIPLLPEEIRPALESGVIDAVEWTTTTGAWDLGLNDIARHAIVPAIWQPSVLSDFLINEQAFNELPKDLQLILESAIKNYTLQTTLKAKVADFDSLKKFIDNGVSINVWTGADIEIWRTATNGIMKSYAETSVLSKKIITEKKIFKQRYDEYYEWFGSYE
jgi:TRAP-type mannitol/chloroaromatic compound transport system substrate-binding protein